MCRDETGSHSLYLAEDRRRAAGARKARPFRPSPLALVLQLGQPGG